MTGRERSAIPPKSVIFDIGRVIVRVNLNRLLEPLAVLPPSGGSAGAGAKPQEIWSAIQASPRWNDWQEGRMTSREWHEYVTAQLRVSIGFAEFCAAWNRVLDPQTILSERLFEQLGARSRLGLLSNTDPLHSAHLEQHFAFMRYFPTRIYSCSIGASKPSPAIYRAALDAMAVSAAEALYIDDIAEYAQAARELGIDAIHFENPEQLDEELSRRGLLGC